LLIYLFVNISFYLHLTNDILINREHRQNSVDNIATAVNSQAKANRVGGGIGAAISEFESRPETVSQKFSTNRRNESFTVARLKKSMNAASSGNLWSGHAFSRPSSLAYSMDDNQLAGIGLNVSRHAIPTVSHSSKPSMFLPLISSHLGTSVPVSDN